MSREQILILGGRRSSTSIVYHYLRRFFDIPHVIIEESVPRSTFLKRRMRRLGLPTVVGQVAFQSVVVPVLRKTSAGRVREIREQYELDTSPIPDSVAVHVSSANSAETMDILRRINPSAVVINGTRILSGDLLDATEARFLNLHAGITPMYRGSHGGYWAMQQRDAEHCGMTVHFVDTGIDTGEILAQAVITPTGRDNFVTIPLLQLAAGLPHLKQGVEDVLSGTVQTHPRPEGTSRTWSHPTLWGYLWSRITRGVK